MQFHWILLLGVQLTNRRQTITGTNADAGHWRIYAALGGDELTQEAVRDCFKMWLL